MVSINYDYSNFNPDAGAAPDFPPEGNYDFRLINISEGVTNDGDSKIIVDYLAIQAGKAFPMNYNTGHRNLQTRQIANEDLGRIFVGITGQKPPANGFELDHLLNGEFNADLVIKKGDKYTNASFRNIKPKQGGAPATAPAQPIAAAQPAVNKPAWATN